jgi:uncharacterized protein YbaR (Trm112 family)
MFWPSAAGDQIRLKNSKSEHPVEFDEPVSAMLVCPVCHGDLHARGERLVCDACERRYPVVDGIPALIAERAELENAG